MAKFFIERPILANVIAVLTIILGLVALLTLPVSKYPNVVPPTVQVTARYPGASFFATGGYHHHVAANIWNSRGAAARQDAMSGLSDYTLRFADEAALTQALAALEKLEITTRKTASGWALKDPWGIGLNLAH